MAVRQATAKDLNAIQELNRQISEYEFENSCSTINVDYSYTKEAIEYFEAVTAGTQGNIGFIYESSNGILGYISLKIIDDKALKYRNSIKQIQLKNLCVDKEHRGKNIGHQLVEHAKIWAKEQGANNLKVVAMAKNTKSRNFYQDCGFEEYEIIHEMSL